MLRNECSDHRRTADHLQPGSKSKIHYRDKFSRDSSPEEGETSDNSDIPEWITDEVRARQTFGIDESEQPILPVAKELDRIASF